MFLRVKILIVIVLMGGFALTHAHSQEQSTAPKSSAGENGNQASQDEEATHDELRKLRDSVLEAIKSKDVDALIGLMTEDVVLITQDGSELKTIRKRDGVRNYVERLLTGEKAGVSEMQINLDMEEKTILYGNDTGVAFGKSNDHYVLADGSEFDLSTQWSATVVKTNEGTWKIACLQLSTNLFDNPVLNSAMRWLVWVGGVCLLFGLILGAVVVRLMRGKN